MFSLLLRTSPLSHPPERQGTQDLPLLMASQKEDLFPLTSRPHAESCTSGTVGGSSRLPRSPLCQLLPSKPPPRTHAEYPPKGLGLLGAKGPPIPNPFTIPEQGGTHPLGDL